MAWIDDERERERARLEALARVRYGSYNPAMVQGLLGTAVSPSMQANYPTVPQTGPMIQSDFMRREQNFNPNLFRELAEVTPTWGASSLSNPFQKVSQAVPAGLKLDSKTQADLSSPLYPDAIIRDAMLGMYDDLPDYSIVTDDPTRPVIDPMITTRSTNMPDVGQTLSADTQLRMLDDAMPRTWGPVPSDGIVPIGLEMIGTTPEVAIPSVNVSTGVGPIMGGESGYPTMDYGTMATEESDYVPMSIGDMAATDPNLQGTTPFSMVNATGNIAGWGVTPPGMLQHQMGLNIEQPDTKYGLPYWDSDPAVQRLVDEDAAIDYDFSVVAPVELDTYGKYRSDTGWHQGDFKGQDSADYKNWVMQRLPNLTTTTPTIERVREFNAIAAGNLAAETAGGLDKIARERIANQEAIERKMEEDTARFNQQRVDEAKALDDSRNLARRKEEERIRKATAFDISEKAKALEEERKRVRTLVQNEIDQARVEKKAADAQWETTRQRLMGYRDRGEPTAMEILAAVQAENAMRAGGTGMYGEYGGGESMAEIQAAIDFAGATGGVVD